MQRWGAWRDRVLDGLQRRRFDALMAYHALIDEALVEATGERGADLYAWTVDDPRRIRSLIELGVGGITTNDPRLFATIR